MTFSPCQTTPLLITYIWLTGSELPLGAIISSLLVIGKASAEKYLVSGSENVVTMVCFKLNMLEFQPQPQLQCKDIY